jgi:hypothetical protein
VQAAEGHVELRLQGRLVQAGKGATSMRGFELRGGDRLGCVRQAVEVGAAVEALQVVRQFAMKKKCLQSRI